MVLRKRNSTAPEHDLRANAFSRLSRGRTGFHFFGSCSKVATVGAPRDFAIWHGLLASAVVHGADCGLTWNAFLWNWPHQDWSRDLPDAPSRAEHPSRCRLVEWRPSGVFALRTGQVALLMTRPPWNDAAFASAPPPFGQECAPGRSAVAIS